jgi:hypothetical protein
MMTEKMTDSLWITEEFPRVKSGGKITVEMKSTVRERLKYGRWGRSCGVGPDRWSY